MPPVLAEAMAMEKPVIAADAGVLVPTKDTERLAEVMCALMLRPG